MIGFRLRNTLGLNKQDCISFPSHSDGLQSRQFIEISTRVRQTEFLTNVSYIIFQLIDSAPGTNQFPFGRNK